MEQTTTVPPLGCVVLLNAFPGVGKLTTAKALSAALPSSRLIDNHQWLDPAYSIEPHRSSQKYTDLCARFRRLFFTGLKQIEEKDVTIIMTNVLETELPADLEIFAEHVDIARARNVPFVLVSLRCNGEVNMKTVRERDVGAKKKLKDPKVLEGFLKKFTLLDPESEAVRPLVEGVDFRCLEIDSTELDVEGCVGGILGGLRRRGE